MLADDSSAVDPLLLGNRNDGKDLVRVRFTNCHFTSDASTDMKIEIDRSGCTGGQTVLEIVGSRGLGVLRQNVIMKGASSSKRSRLIIRDSELETIAPLIDPDVTSSQYTIDRIKNWLSHAGPEDNGSESG